MNNKCHNYNYNYTNNNSVCLSVSVCLCLSVCVCLSVCLSHCLSVYHNTLPESICACANAKMSTHRSYKEELQFIERISPVGFRIKKGFVPNMNVSEFSVKYRFFHFYVFYLFIVLNNRLKGFSMLTTT